MKAGWEYKKLGEFIEEYSVRDKGQGFPVYSVTNTRGFCQEFFGKNVASEDTTNYKVVPRGCFAYNPSRINVGSVAWQNQEDNVSVSPLYVVFSVSPKLRQDYLLYYIKSNYSMTYINALSRGAVRNNLRLSTLKTFDIPFASLSEQEQVVSELDLLSEVIEKQKAQIEDLDKLTQSIFYDMFGDPVINEKGWKMYKWKELFNTRLGKMLDRNKQIIEDKEYPYLANTNVKWGEFDLGSLKSMTFNTEEVEEFKLLRGDLLICEGGESGRCAIWKEDNSIIKFQKAIHRARVKDVNVINQVYTQYYIFFMKKNEALKDYISKATIEHLTGVMLNKVPVLCPPLALQQEFAAKVEQIESMKAKVRQSLTEAETLFNSRMDYYFN